jgi:acetoin utilization deacetylase AcuC-like enzyme
MSSVGVVRDPLYHRHLNDPWHPESPARLAAIDEMLAGFPLRDSVVEIPARDASFEELAWVHEPSYIRLIERTRERPRTVLDPDTSANAHSWEAARRAAGGAMQAVEAVLGGRVPAAFALVRPPGHHAEADRARGFCLFNNVAVAAEYALRRRGLSRVLIVDWDVHHGNGTMHSFYGSRAVLYFSIHQYPHYPGTGRVDEIGAGEGLGYTVNVPLSGGQEDADYLAVFAELLRPIALAYAPELVLVSAGFDSHRDDPLAGMSVTVRGYGLMTAALRELVGRTGAAGPVLVLEGGYDLAVLAGGVARVLEVLIEGAGAATSATAGGEAPAAEAPAVAAETRAGAETLARIAEAKRLLGPYWSFP